jgi:hypothetical protein
MPALDGLAEVRLEELTRIPCRAAMNRGRFMPSRRASMLISDPSVVDRMSSCGAVGSIDRARVPQILVFSGRAPLAPTSLLLRCGASMPIVRFAPADLPTFPALYLAAVAIHGSGQARAPRKPRRLSGKLIAEISASSSQSAHLLRHRTPTPSLR